MVLNMALCSHLSRKSMFALVLVFSSATLFMIVQNNLTPQKLFSPPEAGTKNATATSYPIKFFHESHPKTSPSASSPVTPLRHSPSRCHNVLPNMLNGAWHPREMTPEEEETMRAFHRRVREKEHHIPRGNQRADKRCGNVVVGKHGRLFNFRGLCDPDGRTPCCYESVCQNKTIHQCTCPDCLDMRTRIHAEYATWRPKMPTCQPRSWSVSDICRLLGKAFVHFVGDSLVRHVYTAFLLAARGNFQTGAMKSTARDALRSECSGLTMFSEKICRHLVDRDTTVCNGSVAVKFTNFFKIHSHQAVLNAVLSQRNATRSFVLLQVGLHDGLHSEEITTGILEPLLQTMRSQNLASHRVLWAGVHQFGLMKSPFMKFNNPAVRVFNKAIQTFLARHGWPVFDTYNLTNNVMSFDGTHFGYGVNAMKVNILLHYIHELKSLGKW